MGNVQGQENRAAVSYDRLDLRNSHRDGNSHREGGNLHQELHREAKQAQRAVETEYAGGHSQLGPLAGFLKEAGLVKSYSMDITNDPRFFQDNVINYRLAAIGGLSVVSGLMVQNAMDHIFEMNKTMTWDPGSMDGFIQLISFTLLTFVLFCNMLAVYIGVAQPYHTIRLMTAGPTGFETAASYYLNKNIVAYRHLAIKCMLLSLPVFLISSGLRLVVKFDREYRSEEHEEMHDGSGVPLQARVQGIFFCSLFVLNGMVLLYVHWKHFAVFRDRYQQLLTPPALTVHMQSCMKPGVVTEPRLDFRGGPLDV